MYTKYVTVYYRAIPLLFGFPFPHSLLLPIRLPLLTWNPPCCDRIRPPRSQVARKLIFPFPPLAHIPLIPKSRPPGVSQIQIYGGRQKFCARPPKTMFFKMPITRATDKIAKFCKQLYNLLLL